MNIFKTATKNKIRFNYKGTLGVEEVWDLSILELDELYKQIKKELRINEEEGLIPLSNVDEGVATENNLQLQILKEIYVTKLEEIERVKHEREARINKQKILEAIESKQNQALNEMDISDLQDMLKEL